MALHHSARRSIDDVLYDALKVSPTDADLRVMFDLAAEGFKAAGLPWDSRSAVLGVYAYKARYGLANLRGELLASRPAVVDLLVHLVALADNLDSAVHRGGSRTAYVLRPFLKGASGA